MYLIAKEKYCIFLMYLETFQGQQLCKISPKILQFVFKFIINDFQSQKNSRFTLCSPGNLKCNGNRIEYLFLEKSV